MNTNKLSKPGNNNNTMSLHGHLHNYTEHFRKPILKLLTLSTIISSQTACGNVDITPPIHFDLTQSHDTEAIKNNDFSKFIENLSTKDRQKYGINSEADMQEIYDVLPALFSMYKNKTVITPNTELLKNGIKAYFDIYKVPAKYQPEVKESIKKVQKELYDSIQFGFSTVSTEIEANLTYTFTDYVDSPERSKDSSGYTQMKFIDTEVNHAHIFVKYNIANPADVDELVSILKEKGHTKKEINKISSEKEDITSYKNTKNLLETTVHETYHALGMRFHVDDQNHLANGSTSFMNSTMKLITNIDKQDNLSYSTITNLDFSKDPVAKIMNILSSYLKEKK